MFLILLLALVIAILLEATVISLSLSFIMLLCYSILNRTGKVFISAFVTGLVLDLFLIRPLGSTALFFMIFFSFVLLYQRKYEIRTYPFVLVSSFMGSYLYLFILDNAQFLQAVISTFLALIIFMIGKKLRIRYRKED